MDDLLLNPKTIITRKMSLSLHFISFFYNNPHIPFHIKIQKNLYIKKKVYICIILPISN